MSSDCALISSTAAHSAWTHGDWGLINPKTPVVKHVFSQYVIEINGLISD